MRALIFSTLLLTACGPTLAEVENPCPTIGWYQPIRRGGRRGNAERTFFVDGHPASSFDAERLLLESPPAHDEAARARRWLGATLGFVGVIGASVVTGFALLAADGDKRGARSAVGGGVAAVGLGVGSIGVAVSIHERRAHLESAVRQCAD
jgi:hypothetical protein